MKMQHDRLLEVGPTGPRRTVAEQLAAWSGIACDWRTQVAITPSADSLSVVLEALTQPGDEVVTLIATHAAPRRRWHRRTKAIVVSWSPAAPAAAWQAIAIACLRADAWLVLDARGMSPGQPAGSHPGALPGMARRTITVGSMDAGPIGWIAGPKRIMSALTLAPVSKAA
jgi:hypothetical protein